MLLLYRDPGISGGLCYTDADVYNIHDFRLIRAMEKVHSFGSSCDRLLGLLADARKKSGLSLDDVAGRSGVKRAHVEAIEEGRLDFLPPAYVFSELRQYAAFLGVGDDDLFDEVKKEANIPVVQVALEAGSGRGRAQDTGKVPLFYVLIPAGTLLLIALLWVGAGLFPDGREAVDDGAVEPVSMVDEGPGDAVTAGAADAEMAVAGVSGEQDVADVSGAVEEAGSAAEAVRAEEPVGVAGDAWPAMARGQFTTMVDRSRREPADAVERVSLSAGAVYFFSEISGQKGERVVHVWYHEGELNDRISLGTVMSDSWRGWSMKRLYPSRVGGWRVVVETGSGETLGEANLVVVGEDE